MSQNILFDMLSLTIQAQYNPARTKQNQGTAPPVLLIGGFGTGKNEGYVKPIAAGLNKLLSTVNTPRVDAAEFNGIPWANEVDRAMEYYAPSWAVEVSKNPGNHLVFFDEASDAARSTQAGMHGLLTDGDCGNASIRGAAMVMNINPPEVATTGGTFSGPMGNRVVHINAIIDRLNIIRQMKQGSWDTNEIIKLPAGWAASIPASMSMIGNFLSSFPQDLHISDKELMERGENIWKPCNTIRSWTFFWTLRAAAHASGQKNLMALIADGTVGAPGIKYLQWEKDLEFGDPETWLSNPRLQTMPNGDDRRYAVINAVLAAVLSNNTPDRWNKGWEFLDYMREQGSGDLAAIGAPMLAKNRGKAKNIPSCAGSFIPMLQAAGLVGGGE